MDNLLDGRRVLAQFLSEGVMWNPSGRLACRNLGHHLINLLKRQPLGLRHEEVSEDNADCTSGAPEEEDLGAEVGFVLSNKQEVEKLTRTRRGKISPIETQAVGPQVEAKKKIVSGTSDTNDPLADAHANGAVDQEGTTTKALDCPERQRSRADVDNSSDHRDEEGVVDTDGLKESGREVENEVDTSPLLHHLEEDTNEDLADVGVAVCDATREHAGPADLTNRHLILKVGLNLGELINDVGAIGRLATDTTESLGSSVELLLLDVIARRFRKEEETNGKNDGPGELDGNRDSVCASVRVVAASIGDDRGKHETDGNCELVARDARQTSVSLALFPVRSINLHGTADLAWSNFRHNTDQNIDRANKSYTNARNQAANDDKRYGGGGNLEDNTDGEDTTPDDDSGSATNPIGESTREESTEEGTGRENGNDERLSARSNAVAIGTGLADASEFSKLFLEDLSAHDTIDVTRIVTEQDTSKGGEGTHQVGPDEKREHEVREPQPYIQQILGARAMLGSCPDVAKVAKRSLSRIRSLLAANNEPKDSRKSL
ncbi:general substrate transporter, partial [Aureobasidium melanogenum]